MKSVSKPKRTRQARSIAAIRRCEVAILVIDANDGVTEQDMRIAGLIRDEGKAVIIAVNKWDAVEKETGTLEIFTATPSAKQAVEKAEKMGRQRDAAAAFRAASAG